MFKRFTSALFANLGLKALALVISLAIWFYADSRLVEEVLATRPSSTAARRRLPKRVYARMNCNATVSSPQMTIISNR